MYRIALKMLLADKAKYLMLVSALSFASMMMAQQAGIFIGIMLWTTSLLPNTQAKIWVVDPKVEHLNDVKPIRDIDLYRVRSVKGVSWAVPLIQVVQQARLADGTFKLVLLIGVDPTSLIGIPQKVLKGNLEDLHQANGVVIEEWAVKKLVSPKFPPLTVGDIFEINDHEARVVAIVRGERSFFGIPFVYTTYDRAIEIAPYTRKSMSFVLAEPAPGESAEAVARRIEAATGLKARTYDEMFWDTIWWYFKNTGLPVGFGTTVLLGFIVGIAVSGQIFYLYVLENLRFLGAFKAMGATNSTLAKMLYLQSFTVGLIGFGIGMVITSIFAYFTLQVGEPPFYMPWQVLLFIFLSILFICAFSAYIGIRKISKLEVAEVFRD